MYDTVIFDMDGTLLDTLEDLADAVNAALAHFGYPQRTLEEVRAFVGNGVRLLMIRALPGGEENPDFEAALDWFRAYYRDHADVKTGPYPGLTDLVEQLKARGFRMAIVSNKFQDAVAALSGRYFGDLLPVAIGENEAAGIRKKPAPDTVDQALRLLGSSRERAVYIGDSEVDAATAENAGMPCILVSWGFRDRALLETFSPLLIADKPVQILNFLTASDRP